MTQPIVYTKTRTKLKLYRIGTTPASLTSFKTSMDLKLKYQNKEIPSLFSDPVVAEICATTAFQRLKRISFLGAVDDLTHFSRGLRQNRFDHSIGVALLAQQYAKVMELADADRVAVILAGLLHDVGHAPLSHSLEPLFVKIFGLNHHLATSNLLKGRVGLGTDLWKVLKSNRIDPDQLITLMEGKSSGVMGRIFSSPINIDTIEAIWRGGAYLRKKFSDPGKVLNSFINLDRSSDQVFDKFWEEKQTFYKLMIYSDIGVQADYSARACVLASSQVLREDDFYLDEKMFFSNREKINSKCSNLTITIPVRNFDIDRVQRTTSYDSISKRFTVTKFVKTYSFDEASIKAATYTQPEIF